MGGASRPRRPAPQPAETGRAVLAPAPLSTATRSGLPMAALHRFNGPCPKLTRRR
jgi:hypothetical protein